MTKQPQLKMKKLLTLTCLFASLHTIGQIRNSTTSYSCGEKIQVQQPHQLLESKYDYEEEDLELVSSITDQIIHDNPGKESYEVFFVERNNSKMVLLVVGINNAKQIEKTACDLFSNQKLKFPSYTTILFYDDSPKNNFIVALRKK